MKRIFALLSVLVFSAVTLSAQSARWQLVRAEYGAGNAWVDVTDRVRSLISGGVLHIRADNDTLGGDPAIGAPKTLRLRVRDNAGHERTLEFREKEAVELSLSAGEREHERDGDGDHGRDGDRDHARDGGRLRITRATYGARGRTLDVTDLLNSHIERDRLSVPVNNYTMGGDPARNSPKALTVWYRYDGAELQARVEEGGTLSLPADDSSRVERGLQIVRADYGAENHSADVTARLTSRIRDGQLSLRVNNDTMGGDPAKGRPKRLRVVYLWQGIRHEMSTPEGGALAIP
ncbi:MAG: DNAJC11 domain-containing protein [Candidatus Acidiferrales bacterium]